MRRFDESQKYKPFVNRCVVRGGLEIGSVREISLKSELPATDTSKPLERLDDIEHILGIHSIGRDQILKKKQIVSAFLPSYRQIGIQQNSRATRPYRGHLEGITKPKS
ncbi:Abscisic acid receptor PYL10 [Carex littledalei]|uniref:Abscisic acid receptor PYL10 n=1 Tax=Carex littledalei TaxID=544730 RepID=A0A833QX41_9POAL|nr:Abscisic acid receptor PYL10 [Carex littledalei]